ncbi:MAG: DUF3817 domain-containing protein [Phycisphaerales bacterium]|jgi:integral membrane protein
MSLLEDETPPIRDPGLLRGLIVMGLVEGTSTLALFLVAMPLKYLAGMPKAVTIVGSIHGILFIAYVAMLLWARRSVPISTKLTMWGLVGAVVPFGPFIFDVPLVRLLRQAGGPPSPAA